MLHVTGLSKRYGGQVLFEHLHWTVTKGARVGLVGANGSGKSTLMRMIAGQVELDDGSIVVPKDCTVGYLSQDVVGLQGQTVLEYALSAFADIQALEQECRTLEDQLATVAPTDPSYPDLMERYAAARDAWDTHGLYDMDTRAEQVLDGLGFHADDMQRDCGEFSGGWQMRLALAALLLKQPHLLLLDEPTNHLDLEARNWLEGFLASYPHTIVLVAHDRYFLDVVVQQISEVAHGTVTDYQSNYSKYLVERAQRLEQQAEAYRRQQEEIERLEAFINRFRYQASKAALVQSRVKQLEKIDRIRPPEGMRSVRFRFPQPPRSGRMVLQLEGAQKRYDSTEVFSGLTLTIERGKKIALVGPNGAGKSTLMKILAGVETLDGGTRTAGHNVHLGYFAQDQTQELDPEKTVLQELTRVTPTDIVPQVRGVLGAFLFSGDAVDKYTGVLSGGERNRLALAKLLVHPSNCLLLDEPTNHLDIHAKEVLLDALLAYQGTLILVAHDRYILDRVPEEIIEIGHGGTTHYVGNYEYYLSKVATDAPAPLPASSVTTATPPAPQAPAVSTPPLDRAAEKRARNAERRQARERAQREKKLQETEALVAEKETEMSRLSAIINAPDFYQTHDNPHTLFSTYAQVQKDIETLYSELEKLETALRDTTKP